MENIDKCEKNRDWIGNASVRNCNLRSANAEKNDYYTTEPKAVKEFAERLKEKSFKTIRNYGLTKDVVEVCDIDNLVKETVGD